MTPHSCHAVVPLALVAGAMVLTAAACGGTSWSSPSPTSAAGATVTATATTTTTGTPTTASSSTPDATPSGTPGGGAGTAGTCAVSTLDVTYADQAGGAGAGSVAGTFTFKNAGSTSCTLRGFPGVSYVTGRGGTQVGQPASRTGDAVSAKTLAPGKSARAALRRTQPGNYGGSCRKAEVAGFRVYPPASTEAAFVPFRTTGCKSTSAPLLQVGPVR